jgi:hypothetical protein
MTYLVWRNRFLGIDSLESIPWNRFLGIDSLESIPGLIKSLQIHALYKLYNQPLISWRDYTIYMYTYSIHIMSVL